MVPYDASKRAVLKLMAMGPPMGVGFDSAGGGPPWFLGLLVRDTVTRIADVRRDHEIRVTHAEREAVG